MDVIPGRGGSGPQGSHRYGDEASVEGHEVLAEVDDDASHEPVAGRLRERLQPREFGWVHPDCGPHLDADETARRILEHEVRLVAALRAEVEQTASSGGEVELRQELHGDEVRLLQGRIPSIGWMDFVQAPRASVQRLSCKALPKNRLQGSSISEALGG